MRYLKQLIEKVKDLFSDEYEPDEHESMEPYELYMSVDDDE